jgi:hypothetical protein
MGNRLEDLSVQILQSLLAGRRFPFSLDDIEESKLYVKSSVRLAKMLIAECETEFVLPKK